MPPPPTTPRLIRFGSFAVDLRSGEIHNNGVRIRLQEQPFRVLAMLLEHAGDVVTREELRRRLWPGDTFVDFDQGLNKAINKIREALGDSCHDPRFIETLPKRGYRFVAPVKGHNGPPGPSRGAAQETAWAGASPDSPAGAGDDKPQPGTSGFAIAPIFAFLLRLLRFPT